MALFSTHYFVSITDPQYGAVGDDATDNFTAITAAIAAAKAGNQILYIPAGTFRTSGPLDFSGVIAFGARQRTSILKLAANANTSVVTITNVGSYGLLYRIMVDGNKGQQTIGSNYNSACIRIDGTTTVRITECRATNSAGRGIYVTGGANQVHITSCNIDNCAAWSIDMDAADSAVTDCQMSFGGKSGFTADGSIFGNLRVLRDNVLVDHCHIWQAHGPNVLFDTVRSGIITGCRCDGPTRENIRLGDCQRVQVLGNYMFDAGVYRTGEDNVTDQTRRAGIHLSSKASRCLVMGNRVGHRVKSFGQEDYIEHERYGIYDAGSMNMIKENYIEGDELAGIFAAASSKQAKIRFNEIFGIAGPGIEVQGQEHQVEGNDCTLCGTGIQVVGDQGIVDRNYVVEPIVNASTTLSANLSSDTTLNVNSSAGFSAGDVIAIQCDNGMWQIRQIDSVGAGTITVVSRVYGAGTVASAGNSVVTRRLATGINLTAASASNIGTGNRVLRQSGTAIADAGAGNTVA